MSFNTPIEKIVGELEKDTVSTIYGPGGSGKTCSSILEAIKYANNGKVIYIDTEGGFSIERFKQLAGENFESILKNITFLKPVSFKEQKESLSKLKDLVSDNVKLIIVDTIAMLYRLELGKSEEIYEINRELGRQIAYLTKISRRKNIPILLTNQVYSNFSNESKMVGGDVLFYGSKCLIEFLKLSDGSRRAILKKHRSIKEGKSSDFIITQTGLNCKI